jgi:hypothetical protein
MDDDVDVEEGAIRRLCTGFALAVVLPLLVGACTSSSSTSFVVASRTPAPSGSESPDEPGAFVRACDTAVYGRLSKDWRAHATIVGPLALLPLPAYATATPRTFDARGVRYRELKVLALVEPGPAVTVSVPGSLRQRLSLLYDPAAFGSGGRYRVADGEPVVRFRPCTMHRATQFNGGLIAAGPGCYALDIRTAEGPTRRIRFSLGEPC